MDAAHHPAGKPARGARGEALMERPLVLLVLQVLFLSSVAVGGFISIVPDLHRFVVETHPWMTDERFVTLFALAQVAPGPNSIVVTLIGWEVAGAAGAALATAAACLPTLVIAYTTSLFWTRYNQAAWYRTFERAVAPFAVGLVLATGVLLTGGTSGRWTSYAVTAATVAFLLVTRRSPMIPLSIAAVLGAAQLV
jgi:chromate transporter